MTKNQNKTKKTKLSVASYIKSIENPERRADCKEILELMKKTTGQKPAVWGESIIGFGTYHYKYPSGREGDWFLTGFSNRKNAITVYLMCEWNWDRELLEKLGTYKNGKGCLYIKSLADIHVPTLRKMIKIASKDPMYSV